MTVASNTERLAISFNSSSSRSGGLAGAEGQGHGPERIGPTTTAIERFFQPGTAGGNETQEILNLEDGRTPTVNYIKGLEPAGRLQLGKPPVSRNAMDGEEVMTPEEFAMAVDEISGGRAFFHRYELAQELQKAGQLQAAERALLPSVSPPSAYHGHYAELFLVYRQWNRKDKARGAWSAVIARTRRMIELDDELMACMESAFLDAYGTPPLAGAMNTYRKLTASDARLLLQASEAVDDQDAMRAALIALERFAL